MADFVANDGSTQSESTVSQSRSTSSRSRVPKRASLACVPCRSKHVKCDGGSPACVRCRLEEKACFYAKSRRGIRDAKKRDLMRDEALAADREQSSETTPSPNFAGFDISVQVTKPLPGGWSVIKDPGARSSSATTYLFDLYYAYFHDTHSWLPPKQTLVRLIKGRPEDFRFMASMIAYIGSVYTNAIDSNPLRQTAYELATGPLPTTIWTVQAFLCMCIAAFGEGNIEQCGVWFERAVLMALELGLQNKAFAESESDPILAESYRRTYWGIYLHGSLRTVREHRGHFQLYSTQATTELPCEEWEYQTGDIPTPTSMEEYQRKGSSKDYSSWAYLSNLVRICGESVVPLLNVGIGALPDAVDHADHRIVAWLNQLPKWKKELVDPDGAVDMILFHALGIAHGLRIRIQLHLHGAGVQFRVPDLAAEGPIFLPSQLLPPKILSSDHPWLYGSTALQASLHLVALFKFHLPPEKFSPSCIFGIERAILPMLDAFLFNGVRSPILRDKIKLLADVLGKAGEFWPVSKQVSEDVIAVLETAADQSETRDAKEEQWEAMIDDIAETDMDEAELFHFGQPMTSGEMSAWASQKMELVKAEDYII
ncbi:hypothetical protein G7046_g9888 [Stylonectria norvegica]|nr:hypothetical protein G7046_g9888 [Stylonectria norvegica]